MTNTMLRAELLLALTAFIWGSTFVAQTMGMDHLGPFSFSALRFTLGTLSLLPLLYFLPGRNSSQKHLVFGGIAAGSILFVGALAQQVGLQYTTGGKAAFITGLYIILVPMIGLLLKQYAGKNIWLAAVCALFGLYFLSVPAGEVTSLNPGDLLNLFGAFFWASHLLIIGYLAKKTNPLTLSIVQFATCSVLCWIAVGVLDETITVEAIQLSWKSIAYAGVISVGIAYTLQVVAQQHVPAAHAGIIMSLETVFAVLSGWIILNESLGLRELIGCGFMLAGIVIAQIPPEKITTLFRKKRLASEG